MTAPAMPDPQFDPARDPGTPDPVLEQDPTASADPGFDPDAEDVAADEGTQDDDAVAMVLAEPADPDADSGPADEPAGGGPGDE